MNNISIKDFITDQLKKWDGTADKKGDINYPVITVAREPGSGGSMVAKKVADLLDFYYFHQNIIKGIAKSADVNERVMRSIEKERMTGIEDFISSLFNKEYVWSGLYIKHLVKIIKVIAEHGRAVIVGRGANFVLRPANRFSVRIIAPVDIRIQNISRSYGVTEPEAKKRMLTRASKRRKYIQGAFGEDVENPIHYDMVLNAERLSTEAMAETIINAAKA